MAAAPRVTVIYLGGNLNQPPKGQGERSAPTADIRGFFAGLGIELPQSGGTNVSVRCFADPEAHEHDDRSPSTSVSVETGAWMCHACGAAGGPYHAARAVGLSEQDAQSLLATHDLEWRGGIQAPQLATSERELAGYRESLLANEELLAQLARHRGWSLQAIEEHGLGAEGTRIVFPIRDESGLLVGVARYAPGPDRSDAPKMLADQGSKRELFPAPEAVSEGQGFLFVVEGEPDAVAAHSLGLTAVALPGAAGWQREWRRRFADRKVVLVFDADEAGRKAARQVAGDLVPVAAEVRVLELEPSRRDGYDLSDFLRSLRGERLTPEQQRGVLETRAARAPLVQPERGYEALAEVVSFLRRYVVLRPEQADAIALWVVHTHAFDAAEATPYLAITSAEKESGKTRLLETLELLVAKPWLTGRATPAVLTRKIDAEEPTLLLDESDAAFGGEKEYAEVLRGILNTGYRRGGKTSVAVATGRDFSYRDLSTFSAKAIAGIGKLPDTVQSRSIPIRLKRKASEERVERFRRRQVEAGATPVRERVERFSSTELEALQQTEPELPEELGDRAADVWEPLLAIADRAGGEWPRRARQAALALSAKQTSEDDSLGVRLLGDSRAVFLRRDAERIFTEELLEGLAQIDDAPWGDWYGKRISPRKVAQLLKPYGIRPKTIRIREATKSGYERGWFADAWSRYLPESDEAGGELQPVPSPVGDGELPF
jgi:Protein of unknown function (DUF3631)/Toprim-like